MSKPQFPQVPDVDRQDVINQVISSIALEELALSHIVNAEGEKIQYALGSIPGLPESATIGEVTEINDSVGDSLTGVLENQIILAGKLIQALQAPVFYGPRGPAGPQGPKGPENGPPGPAGPSGPTAASIYPQPLKAA